MISSLVLYSLAAQSGSPVLVDSLVGTGVRGGFGGSFVEMGDLNGDGVSDMVVGSPDFSFAAQQAHRTEPAAGPGRLFPRQCGLGW